jgi:hypothetical protein
VTGNFVYTSYFSHQFATRMLWIGSYTHLLYGLNATTLVQDVLHSTHTEQVTAVAGSGQYLATGSRFFLFVCLLFV